MTISAFDIYLIMLCDDIRTWAFALVLVCILPVFVGVIWVANGMEHNSEAEQRTGHRILIVSLIIQLSLILIRCCVPSTKTAAMMASLPAVINSNLMQKDIPDGIKRLWRGAFEKVGVMETGGMLEQDMQRESAMETVNSINGEQKEVSNGSTVQKSK